MTDASFYSAEYVLLIEDYTKNQSGHGIKTYMHTSFGSSVLNATHLKLSIYAEEVLVVNFACDSFAHILWESTKPVLILTDNRSLETFSSQNNSIQSLDMCR